MNALAIGPFGMGWPEMLILFAIVLVIFGASKIPEIGSSLGKGIREFKSSVTKDDEPTTETAAASENGVKAETK
jgi:sec-independent protein translocase protein TatA